MIIKPVGVAPSLIIVPGRNVYIGVALVSLIPKLFILIVQQAMIVMSLY